MQSSRYSCQILIEHYFYRHILKKKKNSQTPNFTKIRPMAAEFFPRGQTDRQRDMMKESLVAILRMRPK